MEEKEIATFEAKCGNCNEVFDYPSFGDHLGYGNFLLCSENGRFQVYTDAFNANSKLIEVLLPEKVDAGVFQAALAEFADPVFGQKLFQNIRCPTCQSQKMENFGNKKTGSMWIKPATYKNLLALKRNELIEKVSKFAAKYSNED